MSSEEYAAYEGYYPPRVSIPELRISLDEQRIRDLAGYRFGATTSPVIGIIKSRQETINRLYAHHRCAAVLEVMEKPWWNYSYDDLIIEHQLEAANVMYSEAAYNPIYEILAGRAKPKEKKGGWLDNLAKRLGIG